MATRSARSLKVEDVFSSRRPGRCHRRHQGQGLRGHHQAPSRPREGPKRTAPTRTGSRARSARDDARARLPRAEDGRPHGRRGVATEEAPVVRTDAERNLLMVKGRLPGGRDGLILVRKACPMATATLYDRDRREVGTVELNDGLFAAPVNDAVMHQVVTAQLAGRHRDARDEDPRRGPWRRQEAVAPEGHRPRPPGHITGAALRRRRRRLRAAPALATSRASHARCGGSRSAAP